MANPVNAPRGMRDFLPQDKIKRERLIATVIDSYIARGFQQIETPVLEDLDRLTSGQGGDNEKLVFKVQKRGEEFTQALESGQELADLGLRFDLTVPLTRFYASNHAKLPRVFKAIQTGPVFRAERPQKGRYRQFIQCDIDIIGDDSILAELELLSASLSALESIGIKDATIRINHRELLRSNIQALGISASDALSAMITIDKLDKIDIEGVSKELGEKFGGAVQKAAQDWLFAIDSSNIPELLKPIWDGLGDQARSLRFDPTLVRGMGYYTGSIFEIEHPGSGSSIGGGGRYDGMVGKWLGTDAPAVGISLGIERIVDLIPDQQSAGESVVLVLEPNTEARGLAIQQQLIKSGRQVRLEIRPKNLKALLEQLAESGYQRFAIVDESVSDLSGLDFKQIG
ncbi:MAG: histidine--tRNA ligase [Aquiluna sp.]|nr:histidine--tRNA ligase [Aquiluna sp.]